MMEIDLTSANLGRVTDQEVNGLRIANQDVWLADSGPVTYRIWPTTDGPDMNSDDGSAYTMGPQFKIIEEDYFLSEIRFWRSPHRHDGAVTAISDAFATLCGLYDADTPHDLILPAETITHPGTDVGWITHVMETPIPLDTAKIYRAFIYGDPPYYSATGHYWDTGDGASGFDIGPIHVYNDTSAIGGTKQDTFNASVGVAYPNDSFGAANYWIDIGVTKLT